MEAKSATLGITPEEHLYRLIDADQRRFDEILFSVRRGFAVMDDVVLSQLFERARMAALDRK